MAIMHCSCRVIRGNQLHDALSTEFNKFATPEEFKEKYITGPEAEENRRDFLNKTRDEIGSTASSPERDGRQCPPCATATKEEFEAFLTGHSHLN